MSKVEKMHKLLVLYPHPDDPKFFLDYYRETHLPLVSKLPGLISSSFGQPSELGPKPSTYFAIFEAQFQDEKALFDALTSPVGKAVAADVPNYSPKGATLLRFLVEETSI